MNQVGFYFDQTRCIGCYTCSVSCKDWNDIPAGPINWRKIVIIEKGTFPKLSSSYLSLACNHCENPPCVKVCPASAIIKRKDNGVVVVDSMRCIGYDQCGAKCLKVCPWEIPQFGIQKNSKMTKCNLCIERLEEKKDPICVESCPMYALDFGPIKELKEKYGTINEAEGFKHYKQFRPSIVFKPKFIECL